MQNEKSVVPPPLMVLPSLSLDESGVREILERLDIYSKKFSYLRKDKNVKLVVLIRQVSSHRFSSENFPNLEFISTGRNLFSLIIGVLRFFKSQNTYPSTIIAGDPWKGFVVAYLLKKYFFKNSLLQIQMHGKIFGRPKDLNPKKILKFILVKKSIKEADSIRVVSNFQIEEITKEMITNASFVRAPIPIDFRKIPLDFSLIREGIGFVGRIHEERGIELFASIVSNLSLQKIEVPIFVIGDGPKRKKLIQLLTKAGCVNDVNFLGRLSDSDLKAQYSRMKILLSCAPEEGYGLTLREALLSGVMVVARESKGSQSTSEDFQSGIFLYKTVDEAVKLITDIISNKKNCTLDTKWWSEQQTRDDESISAWVATW